MNLLLFIGIIGVLGRLWGWAATLRLTGPRWRLQPRAVESDVRVSVCVPARNEAANIGACLASLAAQTHKNLEILVVDDHSSDATPQLIQHWADQDARIVPLQAPALPEGWGGKCHALHHAVTQSTGEILLFVDADTIQHPWAVATVAAQMAELDVLVVLGGQRLGSLWEQWINPFFWGFVFQFVDPVAATDPKRPDGLMGNGQFAAFRRGPYLAAGGHAGVRDVIIEDVALARAVKRQGARCALWVGPQLTTTRMYRRLSEIWDGFSKNTAVIRPDHRGLDTALSLFAWLLMFHAECWPYVILLGSSDQTLQILAALQLMFLVATRRRLYRVMGLDAEGQPLSTSLLTYLGIPLGAILGLGITLNSIRLGLSRSGQWKGRPLPKRSL